MNSETESDYYESPEQMDIDPPVDAELYYLQLAAENLCDSNQSSGLSSTLQETNDISYQLALEVMNANPASQNPDRQQSALDLVRNVIGQQLAYLEILSEDSTIVGVKLECVKIFTNLNAAIEFKHLNPEERPFENSEALECAFSLWMQNQRLFSVGSDEVKMAHAELETIVSSYNIIATAMEYAIDQLLQCQANYHTANCMEVANFMNEIIEKFISAVKQFLHEMTFITIHPAPFLVKTAEKSYKSKYDFIMEMCFVGAEAFALDDNQINLECKLMSREDASEEFQESMLFAVKFPSQCGKNETELLLDHPIQWNLMLPTMEDSIVVQHQQHYRRYKMRICDNDKREKRFRRDHKPEYIVRWSLNAQLKYGIQLVKELDSFPFLIWTVNKSEFDAKQFIKRVFGEEKSQKVSGEEMALALQMKFKAIASSRPRQCKKPTSPQSQSPNSSNSSANAMIAVVHHEEPWKNFSVNGFSAQAKHHLIQCLLDDASRANIDMNQVGLVPMDNFLKKIVALQPNGDDVEYFDWFFGLPKLLCQSEFHYKLWQRGLIWFCGKYEAEKILAEFGQPGCFLVRVSDTVYETFKITTWRENKIGYFIIFNNFIFFHSSYFEHWPCPFYAPKNENSSIQLEMVQLWQQLGAKKIFKWHNGNVEAVDFMEEFEAIDKEEYKKFKAMSGKGKKKVSTGIKVDPEYQKNQKSISTGTYLRLKLKGFFGHK